MSQRRGGPPQFKLWAAVGTVVGDDGVEKTRWANVGALWVDESGAPNFARISTVPVSSEWDGALMIWPTRRNSGEQQRTRKVGQSAPPTVDVQSRPAFLEDDDGAPPF